MTTPPSSNDPFEGGDTEPSRPERLEDTVPGVPTESGRDMLERLRERGLISDEEYAARTSGMEQSPQVADPSLSETVVPGSRAMAEEPAEPDEEAASPGLAFPQPPAPPSGAPPWEPTPPRPPEDYPVLFDVEYRDGLSRLSTFFRAFLLVPVWIMLGLIQYFVQFAVLIGFTTVFWRKKYPRWLFSGLSGAFGFQARSYAYMLLVSDQFPSFSPEDSPVMLQFADPPTGELSRWRVLFWKLVLLLPQLIVLGFLWLAVLAVTVIAWFAILFTGRYPRGIFQFTVGIQRWGWRITSYFVSFNDRYPPYALAAKAGPASSGTTIANGFVGAAIAVAWGALIAWAAAVSNQAYTAEVDYASLLAGRQQPTYRFEESFGNDEIVLRLVRAVDPGNDLVEVLRPAPDERIIVFQWTIVNGTGSEALVPGSAARLKYEYENEDGDQVERSESAEIITVNNVVAPANVRSDGTATVQAVFVVPEDAEPLELRYRGGFAGGGVKYVFE